MSVRCDMRLRVAAAMVCVCLPALEAGAQADLESGRRSYELCAGCHGFLGEGNALVHAPRLAGLESWYLERQLRNFAGGVRGGAEGDVYGMRMAPMALAVRGEAALEDLVGYIETLPKGRSPTGGGSGRQSAPPASVAGDAERGADLYGVCAPCHGPNAQGSSATSSPGLAHLDAWYVVEQLRLFAEGLRGTHPDDAYGAQMRAFVGTFADEQSRRDIAAYLGTLAPD